MELFEILLILAFILFPIMEQVLKRRNGSSDEVEPGPMERDAPPGEVEARSEDRTPVQAEEMVPDDLWAILTGEKRPDREMEERREEEAAASSSTWSMDSEEASIPEYVEDTRGKPGAWRDEAEPWPEDNVVPTPVSAEYGGPEAYSLERLDYEPVSLETPIASPERRPLRLHATVERPGPRRRAGRSELGRALANPRSLRQAFVLAEVLGPPKGLH